MCQRNEGRFEAPLVTCRLVHVAKLGVRCNQTSPCTCGDKCAVLTLVPGVEPLELLERAFSLCVPPSVDVTGGHGLLAGESRARVERAVGPDRVRVRVVHVAG